MSVGKGFASSLLPQQKPADQKSHPDQGRTFIAEKMRPKLENVTREQPSESNGKGNDRERDQNIADETRMRTHIKVVHTGMPPATPHFFKQKLLPSR